MPQEHQTSNSVQPLPSPAGKKMEGFLKKNLDHQFHMEMTLSAMMMMMMMHLKTNPIAHSSS
jgi:hypothetical protein